MVLQTTKFLLINFEKMILNTNVGVLSALSNSGFLSPRIFSSEILSVALSSAEAYMKFLVREK